MIIALSILLIALNVLDWMLTGAVIENGGRELNPVMRWVINRWGYWAALGVKLALMGACIAACAYTALPLLLIPLCLFFAWVCVSNWRVLKGLGDE
jgi:hypothetical protein